MAGEAIVVAILAGVSPIVVAIVGAASRKREKEQEKESAKYDTFTNGLLKRIDTLEQRLGDVETAHQSLQRELHETKQFLWAFQMHADELRRALRGALIWIADAVEWMAGDRLSDPPAPPDSQAWKDLLETVPEFPSDKTGSPRK